MLTMDEMLNPEDQQPLVRGSVLSLSLGRPPAVAEMKKEDTSKTRIALEGKHRKTRGPGKYRFKPYAVQKMKL